MLQLATTSLLPFMTIDEIPRPFDGFWIANERADLAVGPFDPCGDRGAQLSDATCVCNPGTVTLTSMRALSHLSIPSRCTGMHKASGSADLATPPSILPNTDTTT